MDDDRRRFLQWAAIAPLAAIAGSHSAAASAPACYDPASLPMAQKSLRKSLEFVEVSSEANKRCGVCAFYLAKGDCGTCQILTSPVNPGSYCSSFAPKAA